jgi:integrase
MNSQHNEDSRLGTTRLPTGISKRPATGGGFVYQVRVRKVGHPTFTKTFDKLQEARSWKSSVETKLDSGESVPSAKSSRITIAQAIDDYVAHQLNGDSKKGYTLQLLREELGASAVINLTPELLSKWLKKKSQETIASPKSKRSANSFHPLYAGDVQRTYSESTIRKYYYTLKTVLEWHALFRKYPFQNPFTIVKPPVEDNQRERRLNKDEETRLLDACDKMYKNKDNLKRVIAFALETAMRAGEILKLEWHEVDFETRSIHIPKHKCKTKRDRTVPITSTCLRILKEQRAANSDAVSRFVFGMWESSDVLGHRFKVLTKNAGIDDLKFHDLRHEAASRFFEKSQLNDIEIALITGHSDLRTLKRYTHLRPNSLLKKMW